MSAPPSPVTTDEPAPPVPAPVSLAAPELVIPVKPTVEQAQAALSDARTIYERDAREEEHDALGNMIHWVQTLVSYLSTARRWRY